MPNNEYENEPNQSRSEEIISSILDGTEYDEPARSRIEYLLIQLKEAIEGGGGGGDVTSYSSLTEKPKIDNHTLQAGNNTSSDLGLQTKIDAYHKLSADNVDDTNTTNKFNVKSDWNATSGASSEILNKPNLGTASAKNVPVSGDAATGEVVLGSDTRLTDARNAKDVYNWAKQSTKPTYNYSEIQNTPTIPDELSDLTEDSTHRTVTDAEKGTWSGKQNALTFDDAPTASSNNPVKSGGVYTALAGKQNNLSEAQMDAVNSGATAAKISKITTNENNILFNLQTGVKNCLPVNQSYTLTENGHIFQDLACNVPAGNYQLRFTSTLSANFIFVLQDSNGNNLSRIQQTMAVGNNTFDVSINANAVKTSMYVTVPQEFTISNMMLCSPQASSDYQPYTMSNAELTAAIQALQAQLANQ